MQDGGELGGTQFIWSCTSMVAQRPREAATGPCPWNTPLVTTMVGLGATEIMIIGVLLILSATVCVIVVVLVVLTVRSLDRKRAEKRGVHEDTA